MAQAVEVRKRKQPPKRPQISAVSPREWCRPLAPGVVPAYDLALELLNADSVQIKSEADVLRTRIQALEEQKLAMAAQQAQNALEPTIRVDDELEAMRKKLRILEVQGEINLPDVRWRVANAMRAFHFLSAIRSHHTNMYSLADTNRPVDRHLLQQKWRKDGGLDLLVSVSISFSSSKFLMNNFRWSVSIK